MHPSKVHQSTAKEPDSGLRLGFVDIEVKDPNDKLAGLKQQTPSKIGISSSFDFSFARPLPQLGPEAQRMMNDLREEALRIKAELAAKRDEDNRLAGQTKDGVVGGRKIALPKGKVGRFSDVHMAEFKKMDSIAGHPSAFRAQPGRLAPSGPSLKRTQSKASLAEREEVAEPYASKIHHSERLENNAPAKRARQNITDDASSARPVSREQHTPKAASTTQSIQSRSNMPAFVTTPTQASISRAATVKKSATQIPSLSRSPSKPNLGGFGGAPRGIAKSATMSNFKTLPKSETQPSLHSPTRLDRVKSMFRYPGSSNKATASSSNSAPTRSPDKPTLEKSLTTFPSTPGMDRSKSLKRVEFTPDTVDKHVATIQNSPSPFKSAIPRSASRSNLKGKDPATVHKVPQSNKVVQYPSLSGLANLGNESTVVGYPSLAGIEASLGITREKEARPPPSVSSSFAFRNDHTIEFGSSPKGFGSSPGQASIRQVRQSIFSGDGPGSFTVSAGSDKENKAPIPSAPHEMSNKKRRRIDSDDEEEKNEERSPKKHKPTAAEGAMLMAPKLQAEGMTPKRQMASPTKKKVMSLSRLNMLARPKIRK
jgi:hypothetical protein